MINNCKLIFLIFLIFFLFSFEIRAEEEFKFHLQPKSSPLSSFEDVYSNKLRLFNFKGKVVLLNVWATYCAPCIRELKTLNDLSKEMGNKIAIVPVAVSGENGETLQAFYKKHGLDYLDIYTDRQKMISSELQIPSVPYTLLINSEGVELARIVGGADFSSTVIKAQLKNLLRKF